MAQGCVASSLVESQLDLVPTFSDSFLFVTDLEASLDRRAGDLILGNPCKLALSLSCKLTLSLASWQVQLNTSPPKVTLQTEPGWVGTPGEHATSLAALERGLGFASAPSNPLVLAPPVRRRIQSSLKAVAWNVVASILKQKQETKQTMMFTQSLLLLLLLQLLEVI